MALKETTFIVAVLLCMCSAVKVTIGDLGDVIEGSETRMMCNIVRDSSTSTADPIIVWNNVTGGSVERIVTFQSGTGVFEDDAYKDRFTVDESDGSLMMSNTLRSDSGTYQCSVTILDYGSGDDDVVLDVFYLESPVLTFNTPVMEGDRVEFTCSVVANPSPAITFKKDGASLQSGGQSTYTYQSVGRTNEGNYECEVSNRAGTKSTASQMLEVYYAPEITSLNDLEVSPGDTVVIDFTVEANPAAAYEWTTTPTTADIDSDPYTYTFVVSETIDTMYLVTLNVSNVIGTTRRTVNVTVVGWTTTHTTKNALTTQPDRTTPFMTTTFTTQLPDCDKDTVLIIGIFLTGMFVGVLEVLIIQFTYAKMKQIRASSTEIKLEQNLNETYMEYKTGVTNQTLYEGIRHGVEEKSAYVNVETVKSTK